MVLGLGAWEIVLVGLALLVFFGPEHAPQAIRTVGRWRSRLQATLEQIEEALDEEANLEGVKRSDEHPPEARPWQLDTPENGVEEPPGEDEDG